MKDQNSRRSFVSTSFKTALVIPFVGSGLLSCIDPNKAQAGTKQLNILILGGTSFLGPHQIAYALGRGHKVSIFTRGKTNPTIHQQLFNNVERLVGDRNNDLSALENKKWDAVIDNSGRDVEWTRRSAKLLKDQCDIYLYTSSTGVFYPYIDSTFEETSQVILKVPEGTGGDMKLEYDYGVMKANSEIAAKEAFGQDRTIVVRPTYMIGPADKTNRFIHWPLRLSKGGDVLIPGRKTDPVQYADVRDVAEWMIRLIEEKKIGTYNAAGPQKQQTVSDFVQEASKAFDQQHNFIQIDDYDFLEKNRVSYLVPWIPVSGNNLGSSMINNRLAYKNGFTNRSLVDTVKDTYDWWQSDNVTDEMRVKVSSDRESVLTREQEIIEAWGVMG